VWALGEGEESRADKLKASPDSCESVRR